MQESQFMRDLVEVLGLCAPKVREEEMVNWGGWWRNRYREDPRKAERVLAEIRCMVRESRIIRSPGRAASDLWKRLLPSQTINKPKITND